MKSHADGSIPSTRTSSWHVIMLVGSDGHLARIGRLYEREYIALANHRMSLGLGVPKYYLYMGREGGFERKHNSHDHIVQ